ncbi:MAG: hypothetical protein H7Y88_09815 [Phycisphaerales bacterium]|nr:hypothetical protein [Phycisphaerales bacterium]
MHRGTVLHIGDSFHLTYRARLAELLAADQISLVAPPHSTGDAASLAALVEHLIAQYQPDIALFAAGPHAIEHTIASLEAEPTSFSNYERDLGDAALHLQRFCGRQVIFIPSPPVYPSLLAAAHNIAADLAVRLNRTITQYNQIAVGLMGPLNIGVADLHSTLERNLDHSIAHDGLSLSPGGIEVAAHIAARGVYSVLHS